MPTLAEQLFLLTQRLLPKRLLTQAIGWLAARQGGALTHAAIRRFVARYRVDMSEAANPDPASYGSFNEFFTRPLRADVRSFAQARWICPVDGSVSQFGLIHDGLIFQAKGHHYSCAALLGGDEGLAKSLEGGAFATLYLSPRDYHRIHMPAPGRLISMAHIPGSLYSVNPVTARGIKNLFARNERVVCVFESTGIRYAMVLVGATIVGSMATVWHGVVNPPRPSDVRHWDYTDQHIALKQGDEMGRFLLGSTVILLVPQAASASWPAWETGRPVRVGEVMSAS
jgi:phosphatidylserine decarboxylase